MTVLSSGAGQARLAQATHRRRRPHPPAQRRTGQRAKCRVDALPAASCPALWGLVAAAGDEIENPRPQLREHGGFALGGWVNGVGEQHPHALVAGSIHRAVPTEPVCPTDVREKRFPAAAPWTTGISQPRACPESATRRERVPLSRPGASYGPSANKAFSHSSRKSPSISSSSTPMMGLSSDLSGWLSHRAARMWRRSFPSSVLSAVIRGQLDIGRYLLRHSSRNPTPIYPE